MKINVIHPRVGVDDIVLGAAEATLSPLGYRYRGYNATTEWKTYRRDEHRACYVEVGLVKCIACYGEAFLRDDPTNLFDCTLAQLNVLLGRPDEIGEALMVGEGRIQTPVEYPVWGLQVWFENDRIETILCDNPEV